MLQNRVLNVVQITDLHLFADRDGGLYGLNSLDLLQQVLAQIKADALHRPPIDLLLLTGDLVHDESREGYRLLREVLEPLNLPISCLPGNHDDLQLMCEELGEAWVGSSRHSVVGCWQFFSLNSQLPNQVKGRLSREEFDFLASRVEQYPDHQAVVFLHHSPVAVGSRWLDEIGLENGPELLALAQKHHQIKGIVWGHIHQEFSTSYAGVQLLATPATSVQFVPGADDFKLDDVAPGYRWLSLAADGGLQSGVERLSKPPPGLDADATGY